ncbi:hypothetical protein BN1864_LIB5394:03160 [Pseudomonas sp. 1 R 17]|jgi:hypothetical protein|nr:hypothetical protein [Pseudomonas sp. 1 R 17]SAM33113.1 hypothetical protein BN1864_LIB5394:03160 [Pseudomonas sp. 1 R 17]
MIHLFRLDYPAVKHVLRTAPELLLIQASETLASLNAMTTDLAFELEGANRHKLLAT